MRTIRIAIVGLVLSIVAASVSASPFTVIGLPLVFGQLPQQPVTGWWIYFQDALDER